MKLVIDRDPWGMAKILARDGYRYEWTPEELASAVRAKVVHEGSGEVLGYAWWTATLLPNTLGMHYHWRGDRWRELGGLGTRQLIGDLHKVPELLGADAVIADKPLPATVRKFLLAMGWTETGQSLLIRLPSKWGQYRHGKDRPKDCRPAGPVQRSGTGGAADHRQA